MNYKLDFDTSYHQLYIRDKNSPQDTGDINFWTEDATVQRLAVGDGILAIGLECYGPFKGELFLLERESDDDEYHQYDHIVEGGLEVKSGVLQVMDCPFSNIELEIVINPGRYRARIYSLNLASVIDGESGDDYYKIELWPDINIERTVLKQYKRVTS